MSKEYIWCADLKALKVRCHGQGNCIWRQERDGNMPGMCEYIDGLETVGERLGGGRVRAIDGSLKGKICNTKNCT